MTQEAPVPPKSDPNAAEAPTEPAPAPAAEPTPLPLPVVPMPAAALITTDDPTINAFSSGSAFEAAKGMAAALSRSTLVPKEYQGNAPNCLIALEQAARVGASVFAVMQNLDIIHGRPSWRSTFLIATVNACGRFTPLRFRFQGQEGTDDWGCRAVAKDKKSGDELTSALITIGLAKAEGWATKSGSKWKTMPEQMLMYRAAAFWTRVNAPELGLGMTTDEAQDVYSPVGSAIQDLPAALQPGSPSALEEALLRGDS